MRKIGFECSQSDGGIFIHKAFNRDIIVAMIYVDNSSFMGNNVTLVKEKKKAFMGIWELLWNGTSFLYNQNLKRE